MRYVPEFAPPALKTATAGTLRTAAIALTAMLFAGCAQMTTGLSVALDQQDEASTRNLASNAGPDAKGVQEGLTYWAKKFARNPGNSEAAIAYSRNLRYIGEDEKAMAVLQRASIANSEDKDIASEYGRLALKKGQLKLARKLLARAEDPRNPDWRTLSAQGTLLARLGNNAGAQGYFQRALKLNPDNAGIKNNLALAYALDGQPEQAETILREVANTHGSTKRVRENLALVLGLQGKFAEAEQLSATQLPKEKVLSNVAYLQQMVDARPASVQTAALTAADQSPAAEPVKLTPWQADVDATAGGSVSH